MTDSPHRLRERILVSRCQAGDERAFEEIVSTYGPRLRYYLLKQLGLRRTAVLKWGPTGTQQLSEVKKGKFLLCGYAGNSAPDHVDQLHALPEFLKWVE